MAKIPNLKDFTDVQGMMGKLKSAIDTLSGPSSSEATQAALDKETDPVKSKLLEVELLINQLHDTQLIQTRTMDALTSRYSEVRKLIETEFLTLKEEEAKEEAQKEEEPKDDTKSES